jgi:cysteinyl-tRNA synthetase
MSKSKGNLVMVSDLLKKYSANAIRWILLSHHYREGWEFKEKDMEDAENKVKAVESGLNDGDCDREFSEIMDNDLNTPKALELLTITKNRKIYEVLRFNTS